MKQLTLSFGQWAFSPGLISSLVTVLLFPLFVYLGTWQLHRAEEKRQQQYDLETRPQAPALKLSAVLQQTPQTIRYRQLQVRGVFLNQQQFFLDNQILKGQAGYRVITPFLVKSPTQSNKLLLIDRGWIPMGENRNKLPTLEPILGEVTLTGMINQIPSGLALKPEPLHPLPPSWPLRIQRVDFAVLSKLLTHPIYPFILQLNPGDPYRFSAIPNSANISPTRHWAYAIQWYTMAFALIVYYLAINGPRRRTHA